MIDAITEHAQGVIYPAAGGVTIDQLFTRSHGMFEALPATGQANFEQYRGVFT
ncbi:MAG: hypothetical protein H9917_08910 [Candidatus Oceanisphaera merdipullorum]|nr:hypothetical protein [Candidatus Oceanisphaera merdipullorum]